MSLAARQILDLAIASGFAGADAITATAVALEESGGDPIAINPHFWTRGQVMAKPFGNGKVCEYGYCGDYSLGLWQVNMRPDIRAQRLALWGLPSMEALYDPAINARVAYSLYLGRGRGFGDWSAYNSGAYKRHLPAAQTAWVSMQAEQPQPAVTPPNPTTGPAAIPAAADSISQPAAASTATVKEPTAAVSPLPQYQVGPLLRLLASLLWSRFKGVIN